jgi:hypothetical protein
VTDGVLSDIVTISVLILINTYDKEDPPTSGQLSTMTRSRHFVTYLPIIELNSVKG